MGGTRETQRESKIGRKESTTSGFSTNTTPWHVCLIGQCLSHSHRSNQPVAKQKPCTNTGENCHNTVRVKFAQQADAEREHFSSVWLYRRIRTTYHALRQQPRSLFEEGGTHVFSSLLTASLSSRSFRFLSLAALMTFMVLCRSRSLRASNTRSFHTIRDISCTKYTCFFSDAKKKGGGERRGRRGWQGAGRQPRARGG